MAHPNADLLNTGYDAFDKGDMDTVRELFADDIVFHVPGSSQVSGEYRGQNDVFGFFGKLMELSGGTFKIERHAVLADDEHATVLSTTTAQREGKTLKSKTADVFHVKDGKVAECWTLSADQDQLDAFFA
jgi:ketosteroid isomerase-like protein